MSHPPDTRANLNEVAQRAGCSPVSARQILSGRDKRYSTATRERVWAAARELNYLPNAAARSIRGGRFNALGVLLRHHGSNLEYNILKGAYEAATQLGLAIHYAEPETCPIEQSEQTPRMLQELCVDGMMIHYGMDPQPEIAAMIERLRIPTVLTNHAGSQNAVRPDDADGMRQAIERLTGLGHRRIAWASGAHHVPIPARLKHHYASAERRTTYLEAMTQMAEAPLLLEIQSQEGIQPLLQAKARLSTVQPTAVIADGPVTANLLFTAAMALGLRVPEDLSIALFAPWNVKDLIGCDLACLVIPAMEMGRESVRMLQELIADPGNPLPARILPYSFHPGATLAPPKH